MCGNNVYHFVQYLNDVIFTGCFIACTVRLHFVNSYDNLWGICWWKPTAFCIALLHILKFKPLFEEIYQSHVEATVLLSIRQRRPAQRFHLISTVKQFGTVGMLALCGIRLKIPISNKNRCMIVCAGKGVTIPYMTNFGAIAACIESSLTNEVLLISVRSSQYPTVS